MADEQRFLELRDLVVAREAEWRATRAVRRGGWRRWLGHRRAIDASLLLPARYLPEARRMLKRYAGELDPAVVGYVRRSRRAQIGSQAAIILPLLVIALIGIGAAILIPAVDEEVQIIKDQNTDMLKKSSFGFSFVDGMLRAIGYELARSDGEGRRVIARVLADTRASLDRIGERFPDDDPAIRHGRHEFLGRLADLQLAAGDLAAADESASTLVRESRSVVRADDDAIYGARWALANALERLGDVRARSGDAAAALAAYDECLAIRSRNAARRLEEIDLTRRSLERTIAQTLHKMAPLQPAPERRRSLAELVAILERQALTRALDLDARLWLEQARKDLAAMP
jgi:hypothetical protein